MAVARSVQLLACEFIFTKNRERCGKRTVVTSPHGEQDLADIHTSNGPVGLAPRTTHSSLQSIGTGT